MTEFMRPQVTVETDRRRVRPVTSSSRSSAASATRSATACAACCCRSLPGAAVTSIRVEGVQHEFATIDGVREDVTDIVLNVKGLVFRTPGSARVTPSRRSRAKGPGDGDRRGPRGSRPSSSSSTRTTSSRRSNKGAKLEMSLRIGSGRGYVSADRNKRADDPIGVITVDSLFSPVSTLHVRRGEHACRPAYRLRQAHPRGRDQRRRWIRATPSPTRHASSTST